MAVKVIKVEPDPAVRERVVCRACGAMLEYVPNDVQESHGKDISGGPDGRRWIDCPNCGKMVTLQSW